MGLMEALDRVPEAWAHRWARRTNLGFCIFQVAYLAAWWLAGLRTWAGRHVTEPEAFLLGLAWLPTMIVWLIFQALSTHHHIRRSREQLDRLRALEFELLAQIARAEMVGRLVGDEEDAAAPGLH